MRGMAGGHGLNRRDGRRNCRLDGRRCCLGYGLRLGRGSGNLVNSLRWSRYRKVDREALAQRRLDLVPCRIWRDAEGGFQKVVLLLDSHRVIEVVIPWH